MSFTEKAIRKQEESYKIPYAKKQFSFSCDRCACMGLRNGRGTCEGCPILAAHQRAIEEIASGARKAPNANYGAKKFYNNGHTTIVMNFYNCNIKEINK